MIQALGSAICPGIILFLIFAPLVLYIFYFIPFVHIHTRLQYYVEHNENNEHNLQATEGTEGREQKRWREERKAVTEKRQEGLKKNFVTKMGST